ncbi:YcxB family protein [Paraclostridium sp. AKS81]|nr:YcxB family protein [Paraclostridium sp. AKS81]MCU9811055.1 YcxB family protein [Paraclostridium sp. AKS81]
MSYLLYRFSRVEKVFIKSIEKKLGVKSVIFKELTCTVENNRFMYEQGNNRIEVLFSQIYKVIEDNNAIYIFGKEYLILLIIPTSVFKTSEEKNDFIKKMEVYNA